MATPLQSALLIGIALASFPLGTWISSITIEEVRQWRQELLLATMLMVLLLLVSGVTAVLQAYTGWNIMVAVMLALGGMVVLWSIPSLWWLVPLYALLVMISTIRTPGVGTMASLCFITGLLSSTARQN